MSNELNTVTSVVEQMLDHAAHGRWEALPDVLDERTAVRNAHGPYRHQRTG